MTENSGLTKAQTAAQLFGQGYNCCQAVVGAFAQETGLEPETAMRLASSFGGGVGKMRELCGAVSGMAMVAGLLYGYSDPMAPDAAEAKGEHYRLIQELAGTFKAENGSILCRELLAGQEVQGGSAPEARTPDYYKTRPCKELVAHAAAILEQELAHRSQTRTEG